MENLTISVCNYNTPELINNLIQSINKTFTTFPKIMAINTGNECNYHKFENMDIEYVSHNNQSHGNGVNKMMELIKTRYMLLVDSDIIFLKDIIKPFNTFTNYGFTLMGKITGDRGGKRIHRRVDPWFCFMDLKQLKENNILFYDHYRTKIKKRYAIDKIYDIGSTMFEDVLSKDLTIGDIDLENTYFKHYEGMSWRVQKYNPEVGDTDIDIVGGTHNNKRLYEYGLKIREIYNTDTEKLWT